MARKRRAFPEYARNLSSTRDRMRQQPIASLEAEKGVLGSALHRPQIATEWADVFDPEYFTLPAHKTIAGAILAANSKGVATDYITFLQFLKDRGELEKVGGDSGVTAIFTFVPNPAAIEHYAGIIKEKRRLRHAKERCDAISQACVEQQDEPENVFTEAQKALLEIASLAGGKTRAVSMKENVHLAIERAEAVSAGTLPPSLMTGLKPLDDKLGGLHDGEMIVITGGTGDGKTSLAHNIATHVAIHLKKAVQIFSYEMSALTVTNRMIAAVGGINTEHIRRGTLTERDFTNFQMAATQLAGAPIFIDDDANTTLTQLQAKARKLKATNNTALIIVDLIGKIPASGKASNSRQRDIAENSDGVQKLAMELGIPIVVLSQVNDDGVVREARDVAHDAKTLLKIVRDSNEPIEEEPLIAPRKIIIAKNNTGAIGIVNVMFNKPFVRFHESAREQT